MKEVSRKGEIGHDEVRAFVLCGGLGTRLRSVLADRPKSMAPISGVPFLQLLIERLRLQGIHTMILGTGYMADKIESHFGGGDRFGVNILYSRETEPLGTGGALKLAESLASDPILVMNGDSYMEWELIPMIRLFREKGADVVMLLQSVEDVARYGRVSLGTDGRIEEFVEKGSCTGPGLINAGVYLIGKEIVRRLPSGQAISLEKDVFPHLLRSKVYGLIYTGLFIDIGIPSDLQKAQTLIGVQAHQTTQGSD